MAETSSSGELNVQSCDLQDCKELQQPVPIQATHCRKGVHMIMKDNPCKVMNKINNQQTNSNQKHALTNNSENINQNYKYKQTTTKQTNKQIRSWFSIRVHFQTNKKKNFQFVLPHHMQIYKTKQYELKQKYYNNSTKTIIHEHEIETH
jgi:hypothetical protein